MATATWTRKDHRIPACNWSSTNISMATAPGSSDGTTCSPSSTLLNLELQFTPPGSFNTCSRNSWAWSAIFTHICETATSLSFVSSTINPLSSYSSSIPTHFIKTGNKEEYRRN